MGETGDINGGGEVDDTARDEVLDGRPASSGEAASLVQSALLLRWRAPELALLLADRAVAAAGDDRTTVLRADHLAAFALNRLGRHGGAAGRLLPALQDADTPAELRHELHVELANSAAALGEPATALAALRPVLAAGDDVTPMLRGTALVAAAESAGTLGRGDVVSATLDEADELFSEDPHLDRDTVLLLRGTASAVNAAHHRRSGAYAHAEALARAGRELLTGLGDPEHDSGQVGGRLMLEMVLALLDRGELEVAVREAQPLLRRPVRAAAASAVGWLRLALATRVHLAEGRHEPALTLLADAVEMTQRHGVHGVLAECLEGLSHVHEVRGEFADALHCVRSARAAESRHRRTAEAARSALLEHCGPVRREISGLVDQIAALLPAMGESRAVSDPDPIEQHQTETDQALRSGSDLGADELAGLVDPLGESVTPEPVILGRVRPTLGARGSATTSVPPWALADASVLVNPVTKPPSGKDIAAQAAELAGEAAELAGETAQPAAEAGEPVARLGEPAEPGGRAGEADVGVGEPAEPGVGAGEAGAEAGEAAGREGDAAEPVAGVGETAEPRLSGTRRRRGAGGTPVPVSDLLPQSVLSAGRSGRRRAEDRPEEPPAADAGPVEEGIDGEPSQGNADGPQPADRRDSAARLVDPQADPALTVAPRAQSQSSSMPAPGAELNGTATGQTLTPLEFPVSGPPPAPPPRVLDWVSTGSGGDVVPPDVSMGDLLAGALAAFQESGHPLAHGIDMTGPMPAVDGLTSRDATAGTSRDATNQHGSQPRRTPGLQLAANPVERNPGNAAEALTDPELRLPDLTAEPLWWPPGTGRRSTAGE